MLMQDEDRKLSRWLAGRVDARIVYKKWAEKKPEENSMNLEIAVKAKDVYGQMKFYPECDKARVFASIAGTTTLTEGTLRKIMKLGYRVTVQTPEIVVQEVVK